MSVVCTGMGCQLMHTVHTVDEPDAVELYCKYL